MMRVIGGVWILALCVFTPACAKEAPPTATAQEPHRYRLEHPAGAVRHTPTSSEEAWRTSLVRNLRHRGDVWTYVRVGARFMDGGSPQEGRVFVHLANGEQCYVRTSDPVVVDFGDREIGTSGTDGVSFHPHPAGRIVVALVPTPGVSVLGVRLSDESKCGPGRFAFHGKEATWDW